MQQPAGLGMLRLPSRPKRPSAAFLDTKAHEGTKVFILQAASHPVGVAARPARAVASL